MSNKYLSFVLLCFLNSGVAVYGFDLNGWPLIIECCIVGVFLGLFYL